MNPAVAQNPALQVHLRPVLQLSDDELLELCRINKELHIERTAEGDLEIMSPAGLESSHRNVLILLALGLWAEKDGRGVVTDSSGGFLLPNGAMRAPDAAWVLRSRLETVPSEQRKKFLPLAPDFVVELRSPSDSPQKLAAKMEEYRDQGTRLGWLIEPEERRVSIYRPGQSVEVLETPAEVEGDPELPGFVLQLEKIWQPL